MSDDPDAETGTTRSELVFASTNGCHIVLHRLGGAGPPLIICPATGFHGRAYRPMAKVLRQDFTVWAIDFRGHGAATEPDDGDFAWSGMAADLLAAIDALGVSSIHAIGHSMGGAAIMLAELARPGVIRAAYTFEPIVFPEDYLARRVENPLAGAARKRREVFESKAAALWRYATRPPLDVFRADALAAYVDGGFIELDDGSVQLACRAESEARTFECDTKLTIERITDLDLPMTVGAGALENGSPNPAEFAPLIVAALANGTLAEYSDLGHFGPFQDPPRIAGDARAALVTQA